MKVYSQLEVASLENLASDPSLLPLGRFFLNTTDGRVKFKGASSVKSFLVNDDKIIIGTSGTANDNTRIHRGAAGVLQFVAGGDTTSEGTLSTSLNKLSFKFESYTDAGKPAAGNEGRIAYITDLSGFKYDNGTAWVSLSGEIKDSSYEITNLSLSATVAANALTIAVKTKAGTDPSATDIVKVGFRSTSLTVGTYSLVSLTSALSTVISSGSTAGFTSGVEGTIYVYAILVAGAIELAWSATMIDDSGLMTTSAEGGAGAADTAETFYSTTARTNVPYRLIGKIEATEATAGTWATAPSKIALWPFSKERKPNLKTYTSSTTYFPTPGLLYAVVECWGGGGGGGGAAATAGATAGAGGGGAGGYSYSILTADQIGASAAVDIGVGGTAGALGNNTGGAGGDTAFGATLVVAKGGSGGGGAPASGLGLGGAGGVAGTGNITKPGEYGYAGSGAGNMQQYARGGRGGNSALGSGGPETTSGAGGSAGQAPTGSASGGGGGCSYNGTGAAGAAGKEGFMKITEYFA